MRALFGGSSSSPDASYQLLAAVAGGSAAGSPARLRLLPSRTKRLASRLSSSGGYGGGLLRRVLAGPGGEAACLALVVLPWLTLAAVLWAARPGHAPLQIVPGGKQCLGWKSTMFCNPFAERYAPGDKGCDDTITAHDSGYCVCEGNITTARYTCGPKSFTCRQKCMDLGLNPEDALELPTPISCPYAVPYSPATYLEGMLPPPPSWATDPAVEHAKVSAPWRQLLQVIHKHSLASVRPPGVRNQTHDFVREGKRLRPEEAAYVAARVQGFKQDIPPYPAAAFSGRGVLMIGGGLRYMMSAWVAVHQLRRTGCRLPVEMWYPVAEAPSAEAAAAFAALGVTTRLLDLPGLNISKPFSKEAEASDHNLGRFTIKAAALLLTRFREVIYLDADSFAVRDPAALFDSAEYNGTAALFWPDYWQNTLAPQVSELLGVPAASWPEGSFETGQLVLDKAAHWRGLALAMYLNSYAGFWYEMLSCYLGKGDKETFAYALAAAGEPYSLVPTPPRPIGTTGTSMSCSWLGRACADEFTSNTMGQAGLDGALMFLHSNMHKWDMRLPENFELHYNRRWVKIMPDDLDFQEWQARALGYDLERQVYDLIRHLKCQPWWPAYYAARVDLGDRKTPELDGFHFLLRGLDMHWQYVQGWDGNYVRIVDATNHPGAAGRFAHWFTGHPLPWLQGWHLLPHGRD